MTTYNWKKRINVNLLWFGTHWSDCAQTTKTNYDVQNILYVCSTTTITVALLFYMSKAWGSTRPMLQPLVPKWMNVDAQLEHKNHKEYKHTWYLQSSSWSFVIFNFLGIQTLIRCPTIGSEPQDDLFATVWVVLWPMQRAIAAEEEIIKSTASLLHM